MPKRPCWVEISTRSLEDNYRFLSSLADGHAAVMAVVKSDAYGHGLALCAPAAVHAGARWLGVTSVEEGVLARSLCPQARILVMSGCFPGEGEALLANGLTPVVWESHHIAELERAAHAAHSAPSSICVHLEVDTGMSRQGITPETLPGVLARLGAVPSLRLEAVHSHLFAADEADGLVTVDQLTRLEEALQSISAAGLQPEWLSVGASAALLDGQAGPIGILARRHGMKALLRPGLALYGIAPPFEPAEPLMVAQARSRLKPVFSWKTQVAGLRTISPGAVVGYNGTFVATEPMRLALLPVGYADGLDRRLGNHFSLLIRGELAPLVGRISMDLAVIDVTEISGVEFGDEVVILGSQGNRQITALEHAQATGTIPWEVFTRIGARVQRIAIESPAASPTH